MSKPPIKTYPLKQMTLEQAIKMQFKLVEVIRRHLNGKEQAWAGDLGRISGLDEKTVRSGGMKPVYTQKVEKVLAEFFGAKEATLTRGAGTGAIRSMFMGALKPGDRIVIHQAPNYPTTEVTMRVMGLDVVRADMNNPDGLKGAIDKKTKAVFIIHSPVFNKYRLGEVVSAVRSTKYNPLIMVDDNYVAMRVERIGVQLGADLSTFSMFKLLSPEGMGVVLGGTERGAKVIEQIRMDEKDSAGVVVQGPEAMETLRSLTYAPVMLAIHKNVVDEICERLNKGEIDGVDWAVVCNAYTRQVVVKLKEPIARKVHEAAWKHGSLYVAISVEGKYETVGRISLLRAEQQKYLPTEYCVKIRPYRAGPDTMIDMLKKSIEEARRLSHSS